jgi:hypothetical protein
MLSECACCGTPIQANVRHPTYTELTDDGELQLYIFCDDICKSAWLTSR